MKAVVAAFNQEKALVGAFSVIVQPVVELMDRFTALEICLEKPQLRSELLTLMQASHTALDCAPAAVNLLSKCSRSGARSAALGPGPEVLLLLTRCCCGCCCCCRLCCCCLTPVTCSRLRWPCNRKYSTTILNTTSITIYTLSSGLITNTPVGASSKYIFVNTTYYLVAATVLSTTARLWPAI